MSNPTNAETRAHINEQLARETPAMRLASQNEPGWYTTVKDGGDLYRGLWVTTRDVDPGGVDLPRSRFG
jgi:hypothetical protein